MTKPVQLSGGEIPGISQALLESLLAWRPSELGVCVVDPAVQVVLPYPEWYWYTFVEQLTSPEVAIGSVLPNLLYTVPVNERAWLDGISCIRDSGDNLALDLRIVLPAGYGSGTRTILLTNLTTADDVIYWPAGLQTVNRAIGPAPVLLEPGTLVELIPSGAGSATSTWNSAVLLRRTNLVRSMVPQ